MIKAIIWATVTVVTVLVLAIKLLCGFTSGFLSSTARSLAKTRGWGETDTATLIMLTNREVEDWGNTKDPRRPAYMIPRLMGCVASRVLGLMGYTEQKWTRKEGSCTFKKITVAANTFIVSFFSGLSFILYVDLCIEAWSIWWYLPVLILAIVAAISLYLCEYYAKRHVEVLMVVAREEEEEEEEE